MAGVLAVTTPRVRCCALELPQALEAVLTGLTSVLSLQKIVLRSETTTMAAMAAKLTIHVNSLSTASGEFPQAAAALGLEKPTRPGGIHCGTKPSPRANAKDGDRVIL